MNSLTFNAMQFHPIQSNDQQIWIPSTELSSALGYSRADAVTKIYDRNNDEFAHDMTKIIDNPQNPNLVLRVFSLRGAHLITFFARTPVAKEFRKWVLDILDKEVGAPVAKTHKSEREPLTNAVNMLVAKTKHLNYSDAYKLVHQRFNVEHIEDIPYDVIPVAVEYVHHLIALYSNAEKKQFSEAELQNLHALATHMIWVREWWREFGDSIKKLNPTMYYRINDNFKDGAFVAWWFVKPTKKQALEECVKNFDWLAGTYQKNLPI
ncbi:BRO-N domain-containing protein [Acinetobacter wuhouensis]|uniref:BRO-N domain-containing protein n=1 Tax=Acinetobacter wuhouensis TaxID=1879050 RepID=UPI00083A1B06